MAGTFAIHALPAPGSPTARARLAIALAASFVLHAWLLAGLPQGQRAVTWAPAAKVEARLELGSDPKAVELGSDPTFDDLFGLKTAAPRKPRPAPPATRASDASMPSPVARAQTEGLTPGKQGLIPGDPTWYAAHELDTYPRALAPLRFDTGRAGTTRVRLWLKIDEAGRVVEVTAGEAGVPLEVVEAARAALAAVAFVPARREERAVKARVLLSVSVGGAP